MSENQAESSLNPGESKTATSENNVNKDGEKVKRNYCYLCKIQCSGNKNFEDHNNGKKHLKNLKATQSVSQNNDNIQAKKKNSKKKNVSENVASSNSSSTSGNSPNAFKITNSNSARNKFSCTENSSFSNNKFTYSKDSNSGSDKLSNTEMNTSQRYFQKNNRYNNYNGYFESRHPRNQNSRCFNPRGYQHNNYYYRDHQSQSYPPTSNSSFLESSESSCSNHYDSGFSRTIQPGPCFEYNGPNMNVSAPGNNYAYLNPFREYAPNLQAVPVYDPGSKFTGTSDIHQSVSNRSLTGNFDYARSKYSNTIIPSSSDTSNTQNEVLSNHGYDRVDGHSSKDKLDGRSKDKLDGQSSKERLDGHSSKDRVDGHSSKDKSDGHSKDKLDSQSSKRLDGHSSKDRVDGHSSKELSSVPGKGERTQLARSRSLSASETGNEKKKEDKSEGDVNVENGAQEQRIKEWTNSLLETSNNKISRLVNPSNFKEKAALNHLLTKFSKSKRKEILTRTLRSNSMESIDNYDEDMNTEVENISLVPDELNIILDSNNKKSECEQYSTALNGSKKNYSKSDISKQLKKKNSINASPKSKISKKSSYTDENNATDSSVPSPKNKKSKKSVRNDEKNGGSSTKSNESTENAKEKNTPISDDKIPKRKAAGSDVGFKVKKRKSCSLDGVGKSVANPIFEYQDFEENTPSVQSSPVTSQIPSQVSSAVPNSTTPLKKELFATPAMTESVPSGDANSQNALNQGFDFNSEFTVESLIQLFASGTVKVKTEFNDPMMEAIKELNPDELLEACSNNQPRANESADKTVVNSTNKNSKSKSFPEPPSNNRDSSLRPVILGSAVINDDIASVVINQTSNSSASQLPSVSNTQRNTLSSPRLSSSDKSEVQGSVNSINNSTENSAGLKKIDLLNKSKTELPPQINRLIKRLKDVVSKEETAKEELNEAKLKIIEYSALLEEWKNKEKKLQDQEEDLRKQRNTIIKIMQDAVEVEDSDEYTETSPSKSSATETTDKTNEMPSKNRIESNFEKESAPVPAAAPAKRQKKKEKESPKPKSATFDEITILPVPCKPEPPEIVLDDVDENTQETAFRSSNSRDQGNVLTRNLASSGPSFCEMPSMNAHTTVINCLVVFEDFLYTCSNDSTAKRFSLRDPSQIVKYYHTAKNVTEIVVEKVQNEALVFTSCSTKVISLFIASSGTKIKTFFPPCAVMSICKGWGKFYSGFANGAVNVYNWKYEEIEIVKTESCASRIATAHQGRLHVLVILSSEGNISIRDAETGLLIRYIKVYIKHPALMTLSNDLVYLSSADKALLILDLMNGRVDKRLHLNHHTTGLAVYDDYIFTISYSGIISCYNKDMRSDKKLYYGAGKNGLTCVYVYQDLVFTGNRKGDVSQFQFDPCSIVSCQFSKCDAVYGLREDLEYHVEKDHLKKNVLNCNWKGCGFVFPRFADTTDKMNHMKSHIYEMHLFVQ